MGGAIEFPGNISVDLGGRDHRFAEFNIHSDPEAAAEVFSWLGPKVVLVGKDACDQVTLSSQHIRSFLVDEREVTHELMRHWLAYQERRHSETTDFPLYDPLTVAVAIDQDLVKQERINIVVDTTDELRRGQTRRSDAGPVVNVAMSVVKVRESQESVWQGAFNRGYPGESAA